MPLYEFNCFINVEAENEEQAWQKADMLEDTSFEDSGYGKWEIDSVDEVTK